MTVVPANAGTHTPCPIDKLRSMGPGPPLSLGRDDGNYCFRIFNTRSTISPATPR